MLNAMERFRIELLKILEPFWLNHIFSFNSWLRNIFSSSTYPCLICVSSVADNSPFFVLNDREAKAEMACLKHYLS